MIAPRWRFVIAGVAAAVSGAYELGRRAMPARVEEHLVWRDRVVAASSSETSTSSGPQVVTRVVTRIVPGPRGPERIVERERIVQGPSTTLTRSAQTVQLDQRLEQTTLQVAAPAPFWSLSLGAQLTPETLPVIALGRRLVGPLWVEGWVRPRLAIAPPAAGASVRLEW